MAVGSTGFSMTPLAPLDSSCASSMDSNAPLNSSTGTFFDSGLLFTNRDRS